MRFRWLGLWGFLLVSSLAGAVEAQTVDDLVILSNGGRLRGVVIEHDPASGSVTVKLADGTIRRLRRDEVAQVTYGGQAQPPPPPEPTPRQKPSVGGEDPFADPGTSGGAQGSAPIPAPRYTVQVEEPGEEPPVPRKKRSKADREVRASEPQHVFASQGQKVLRGEFMFQAQSIDTKDVQDGRTVSTDSSTSFSLAPEFGYFVADGIELGAGVVLGTTSYESTSGGTTSTASEGQAALRGLANYHSARTEPYGFVVGANLGLVRNTSDAGGGRSAAATGWGGNAHVGLEILVGDGGWGVLTLGAALGYASVSGQAGGFQASSGIGLLQLYSSFAVVML